MLELWEKLEPINYKVVKSKYAGKCSKCKGDINVGEEIVLLDTFPRSWVHLRCAPKFKRKYYTKCEKCSSEVEFKLNAPISFNGYECKCGHSVYFGSVDEALLHASDGDYLLKDGKVVRR